VGIIGLGKIGLRTAKLFLAFGAKVIAFNRSESSEAKSLGIKYKSLDEVLSESDIISIHLPLNESTKGIISKEKIALMRPNTIFINCARGPIVDNNALAEALNGNRIGFACLDVFDNEPPLKPDYPLLNADNTILTPHQAFISEESMARRAKIVFDNVYEFLNGTPINICKL
jgi:phosphoglycerate dehydrogenase-like enzyme